MMTDVLSAGKRCTQHTNWPCGHLFHKYENDHITDREGFISYKELLIHPR